MKNRNTGQLIKDIRQKKGITATELAKKIGVHHSTIYRYEKGDIEKVPANVLSDIAKALGVSPETLLGKSTYTEKELEYHEKEKILGEKEDNLLLELDKSTNEDEIKQITKELITITKERAKVLELLHMESLKRRFNGDSEKIDLYIKHRSATLLSRLKSDTDKNP